MNAVWFSFERQSRGQSIGASAMLGTVPWAGGGAGKGDFAVKCDLKVPTLVVSVHSVICAMVRNWQFTDKTWKILDSAVHRIEAVLYLSQQRIVGQVGCFLRNELVYWARQFFSNHSRVLEGSGNTLPQKNQKPACIIYLYFFKNK